MIKVVVVAYPDRKNLMMRHCDPMTGRTVARTTGTTKRREAERVAAKWEAELQAGRPQPGRAISWKAFRERYEREVLPSLSSSTERMVGTVFNAVEAILRPKRLQDITAERVSYFQSQLRDGTRGEATIRTYLAHLAAALAWAVELGFLPSAPKIQMPKRAKGSKLMKGRPITNVEFQEMLAQTEVVVGTKAASVWRFLLEGLWWSGLRLGEALELYWDREDRLRIDLSSPRPMLRIPAALEKGNQDRLLPVAPEFAEFLHQVAFEKHSGPVFPLIGLRINDRPSDASWVSKIICRIGRKAAIRVNIDVRTGKVKYASAHDLRRSFGERWARKVMPQVLKEIMRHSSIETTLKYYVGHNAQLTADVLWSAYRQGSPEASSAGLAGSTPAS